MKDSMENLERKKTFVMRINSMTDDDSLTPMNEPYMAETVIDYLVKSDHSVDDPAIIGLLLVAAELRRTRAIQLGSELAAQMIIDRERKKK